MMTNDMSSVIPTAAAFLTMPQPETFVRLPNLGGERVPEDDSKAAGHCTVACVYHARVAGFCRNVTVVWSKTLITHGVAVAVETYLGDPARAACKIELKPWPLFWTRKGSKALDVDGARVHLFWDLRAAEFSATGSPEPAAGFFLALVSDDEVALFIGDLKKDAYKKTKAPPSLVDAALVSKRENVFGRKCFSTRCRFEEGAKERDIVVENSISGRREPEMWISVDGLVMIHVKNLHWKFRGNETIVLNDDQLPVQVFWDVHNWLFCAPGTGHALFIFKAGAAEYWWEEEGGGDGDEEDGDGDGESSKYYSVKSAATGHPFCLFLYAWKME